MLRHSSVTTRLTSMRRSLKCFNDKLWSYVAKAPAKKAEPAWHRLAYRIKNNTDVSAASHKHIETLKESGFDENDSIGKLEHELQEEIACALGRTGAKCNLYFSILRSIDEEIEELMNEKVYDDPESLKERLTTLFSDFNEVQFLASKAIEYLKIHRQAVGFTYNNHQFVQKQFPLPKRKNVLDIEALVAKRLE